jgi:hypothetical protein
MTMTYARKSLPFLVILAIVTLGCRKSQIAVDDVALDPSSSKRASTPSARREVLLRAVNSALERKRIPAPRRAALLGSLRVLSSSNGAVSDAQKILAALPRLLAKNLNLTAEELASTLLTVADSLAAALSEAAKAEGKPLKASDTETARAGLYAAASLALVSAIKDSSEALRLLSDVFQELGVDAALVVATSNALASTWKLSEGSKKALLGVLGGDKSQIEKIVAEIGKVPQQPNNETPPAGELPFAGEASLSSGTLSQSCGLSFPGKFAPPAGKENETFLYEGTTGVPGAGDVASPMGCRRS